MRTHYWKCQKMKDLSLKQKKEKDLKKQYKSNTRNKEKKNMTLQEIHDFKKKEVPRIRALRNKKRSANEQTNKEKAKALLQIVSKK